MKKYIVRVDGKAYDVEVETVKGDDALKPVAKVPPVQTSEAKPEPAPEVKPDPVPARESTPAPVPNPSSVSENSIPAPMAGTIIRINVKAGDPVKKGDVLLVLEAMKMENDVMASADGKIRSVDVTEGATINAGDALITLE